MIWIKTEKSIAEVTECYLDTIGDACQSLGYDVKKVEDIKDIKYKKGDYVVVSNATSGIKAIIRGFKIIYWAQGLWPEESFMRNKSRLRYLIAGILEKKSLKKAAYCLFVSGEMKSFYEKKYHIVPIPASQRRFARSMCRCAWRSRVRRSKTPRAICGAWRNS